MRVCFFGTFERDYPRNRILIEGLRAQGVEVLECHEPLWERTRDKTGGYLRTPSLLRLSFSLGASYLRLLRKHQSLPPHGACLVGYIGQADLPLARLLHRGGNCPVVFIPMVSLYDTLVWDRRLFSPHLPPAWFLFGLDLASLRLADLSVLDTEEERDFFSRLFGLRRQKTAVLPVGAEEKVFYPRGTPPKKKGALEVLFYGKFIPLHGIPYILEAAGLLPKEDFHFTLIGQGQLRPPMEEKARRLGLSQVSFKDWVPLEELPLHIERADVCLGIFDPGEKAGRVVPNKVYQALAMAKPVITGDSPAARSLLEGSVLFCPRGSGRALAQALRLFQEGGPNLWEELGRRGYEHFLQHFSSQRIGARMKEILQGLT